MSKRSETERVRAAFAREAGRYDRQIALVGRALGFDAGRRWVCARASGESLEIGIGTGLSLPFYPSGVRLTGIDLTPEMLDQARTRALGLGREVDLLVGDAQELPFGEASFDAVLFTLCLCCIPDDRRAVAEAGRVLRPGGRLLLLEHVRSPLWIVRGAQRLLDPVSRRTQGDHLLREPLEHLRVQGFVVEEVVRSALGIVEKASARKPAA